MRRSLAAAHASFRRLPAFEPLASLLGRSHAERETRWMAEHIANDASKASTIAAAAAERAVTTRGLEALSEAQVARLAEMVEARSQRQPLQYLLGEVSFLRLPLLTRAPVLIPRPETEAMVAWVLARWSRRDYRATHPHLSVHGPPDFHEQMQWMKPPTKQELAHTQQAHQKDPAAVAASSISPPSPPSSPPLRILDLCSGSGNIALSLYHHMPLPSHVLGCDISSQALRLARDNLQQLERRALWAAPTARSHHAGGSIHFAHLDLLQKSEEEDALSLPSQPSLHSDPLLSALLQPPPFVSALSAVTPAAMHRVNLIVSNPPYIPVREFADLQAAVRDWEDYRALISGDEGMDVHEAIIRAAPTLLHSRKMQLMETIGSGDASSSSLSRDDLLDTSQWDVPELVFELGSAAQVVHLTGLLQALSFEHVTIHHDLAGLPRFIAAAREKHVPK